MTKKSDAPAIRFKGFSDAWEQRKFSDITFPAGEKNKDNLPLESYSITNEHGFVPQDEKFENGGTMREADKRMYYIVSPNSFAYNPARINVGSIGYQNIGKNVIVSSLYEVFKTSEDVDDRLLWHWFKSPDFQKLIMQLQEGGVRLYFYYDKLCMGEVSLPLLEEQRKIGKLFDTLDNLITLHQRKFEKLTNVKKSMLEKMFPQNGSSYPEIRFKGFTDPWEQRKVSELFRVTRGYVLAATQTETTKTDEKPYPVYSSQTKDKGLMGYYKDYLYEDAITWTTDGANAGTVNYRAGKFYCTNVCGVLLSNEVKANQMIAEALNSVAKGYVSYVGNPKLMNNVMADIVIQIPTQAEEREQLSSFFAKLDNLITLHQRELEKLQNIKKSMLEKMFV